MDTAFRKSFTRDLRQIKDRVVLDRVQRVIEEVEAAESISVVKNVKKLSGASDAYRIRIGEYRIGLVLDEAIVEFIRCLHRRDLYRFFP